MITCSECTTPDECASKVWCYRRPPVPVEQDVDPFTHVTASVPTGEPRGAWVNPYLAPEQVRVLGPMTRRRAAELEQQARDDADIESFAGWFPVPRMQTLDARAAPVDDDSAPVGLPPRWAVRKCLAALAVVWAALAIGVVLGLLS